MSWPDEGTETLAQRSHWWHHDLNHEEQELLKLAGDQLLLLQLSGPLNFGALTAALAIEAICFDCRDQKRQVYIVTATEQPRERLHRLKVPTIPEVTLSQSRLTALAAAISPKPA